MTVNKFVKFVLKRKKNNVRSFAKYRIWPSGMYQNMIIHNFNKSTIRQFGMNSECNICDIHVQLAKRYWSYSLEIFLYTLVCFIYKHSKKLTNVSIPKKIRHMLVSHATIEQGIHYNVFYLLFYFFVDGRTD